MLKEAERERRRWNEIVFFADERVAKNLFSKSVFFADARVPKDLNCDMSRDDLVFECEGYKFLVHKNDHLPPHVHVTKCGIKSLICIDPKDIDEDRNHFPPFEYNWIRHVVKEYKTQFLKKWAIQNPDLVKEGRNSQSSKQLSKKKSKKRDSVFVQLDDCLRFVGANVMPVSNEFCDLDDYPQMRKWRRFDELNTIAVEFVDDVIRLYPIKIFEILHRHVGYGGYQFLCGERFKQMRLGYYRQRMYLDVDGKRISYIKKCWCFKMVPHRNWNICLGEIYHYGISFDGFSSIDDLCEEDVIRIAAADGLDLLSPPSYGPGGMTKQDLEHYYKLARTDEVVAKRWIRKNGFIVHPDDFIECDDPNFKYTEE